MDTIAVTDRSVESRPDYSSIIREEIERDVAGLITRVKKAYRQLEGDGWEWSEGINEPQYVLLGYTINMHAGRDIFTEDDLICGLPVFIDRYNIRSITVKAACDMCKDRLLEDEYDSDWSYEYKDFSQSITW